MSILIALAAAGLLASGSLGFTSVSADRAVTVNVVEPEDAYVDVSVCSTSNGNGSGGDPVEVTVANQYSEPFTVESITWDEDAHESKEGVNPDVELGPGEVETFRNTFGNETVTVTVSGSLEATVTVDVGPKCEGERNGTDTTVTTTATPSDDS